MGEVRVELFQTKQIFRTQTFLQLKYIIDIMHVKKNLGDSFLGAFLMNKKSTDTSNARDGLEKILEIQRT